MKQINCAMMCLASLGENTQPLLPCLWILQDNGWHVLCLYLEIPQSFSLAPSTYAGKGVIGFNAWSIQFYLLPHHMCIAGGAAVWSWIRSSCNLLSARSRLPATKATCSWDQESHQVWGLWVLATHAGSGVSNNPELWRSQVLGPRVSLWALCTPEAGSNCAINHLISM